MRTYESRCRAAALLAASLLLSTSARAGTGGCPTSGYCQLPRWIPAEAGAATRVGERVELSEQIALVGSEQANAVLVYERIGGHWTHVTTLLDPSGGDSWFGMALEIAGDRLLVGAPRDDFAGTDAGAVYGYAKVGDSWTLVETLRDPFPEPDGHYGTALACDGERLFVGEPGDSAGGIVHGFERSGDHWDELPELSVPGSVLFGHSLALGSGRVFVGDPNDDQVTFGGGRVHVFTLTQSGATLKAEFALAAPVGNDNFGLDLACDGKFLVVGCPGRDIVAVNAGAAFVYDAEDLGLVDTLYPCPGTPNSWAGTSVAVSGPRIALGSPWEDDASGPGGRVHVFRRPAPDAVNWEYEERIAAVDADVGDEFGFDVALFGNHVLIGADEVDEAGLNAGAAYMVSLSSETLDGGICPCDDFAVLESYGAGKPGLLGVPQLGMSRPPVIGEPCSVVLSEALPGTIPVLAVGTLPALIPFDDGFFRIADPIFHELPVVPLEGLVEIDWAVPMDLAFCGAELYLQAFFVDPAASGPFHTAQTNGLRAILGF